MRTPHTFLAAFLLCIIAACTPEVIPTPDNNDPDPITEPETPEEPEEPEVPEVVVSKGAYQHVVIIGADGAGAFFRDTDTPRCDGIFAGGATTYTCRVGMPS